MAYQSLREFLEELKKKNQLITVKEPVSTYLEITEIHKRILKDRGPAILFENVLINDKPSNFPMIVNLFGSKERIAMGLNTTSDKLIEIGETLAFLRQPTPPKSLKDAWSMTPLIKTLLSMKPKQVSKAPCQEIVWTGDQIDLTKLPIQFCWPGDAAPLITWPLVVTKGPSSDKVDDYNLGIYRMQYLSPKQTLVRWLKTRGGAAHYQKWAKDKNTDLPMAVVIGADPATILAAVTPVPETLSEYQFSGLLRKKSLELVKCKTIDLEVPAHAEIILEGYVSLNDYQDEGPFGDHTGYYNEIEKFPVFNITAITMRKDAIYLSTYTGKPDDEPSILGEALNEIFIPLLKQQFPEIVDFYLPPEGCSYRIAVVSIKKTYPGQAKRIMFGIWSVLRQFILTKFIYVVDADIDCRNWKEVMWAVSTKMDPSRDITIIDDAPIDYLDFASVEASLGGKVGFDATNKIYPETKRNWGKEIEMDKEIIDLVDSKWEKYGF